MGYILEQDFYSVVSVLVFVYVRRWIDLPVKHI